MSKKLEIIDLQSKLIDEDWDAAENSISELDEQEKTNILGATPPDGPPSNAEKEAHQKMMQAEMKSARATAHPSAVDWRNKNGHNYVTDVKNQGGCGSCVAFGTISALESAVKISKNSPGYNVDLSEAHLFYCLKGDPNGCSNGWWPQQAYDKIQQNGVAKENFFPYTGSQQSCRVQNGWEATKTKITGSTRITNVNQIKEWIANKGPVSACYEVFQDFYSYRSGVYRHVTGSSRGWHCVSVVGYNDAGGYWICKNSWGSGWGDNGYFKIKYGECSIELYGMWGVNGIVDTTWLNNKKVLGLWANSSNLNVYAYIQDEGWKKIANNNQENLFMILTALIAAKNANKTVNVHINNGLIDQIYS